jgi:hydroxyethylthiazole kinase-like uncharacterized protein yjeF
MILVADMKIAEHRAVKAGVSEETLMENAGTMAAGIVDSEQGFGGKTVTVFCGTGNNAGDGLVLARHAIDRGAYVMVYFVKGPGRLKPLPQKHYDKLGGLDAHFVRHPEDADILVDAMLGTGIRGNVHKVYRQAIAEFNSMTGFKVSLDNPSGIDCDTGEVLGAAVKPDMTVTFHDIKAGMNGENSGRIVVADIGIPKV